jgi:hypothetical protein
MAVISITITESSYQIIDGIPRSITLETNLPSTIFYTFDKTDPTTSSAIYLGTLSLPTNNPSVTLKIFATNGVDSSAIITKFYGPDTSTDTRQPHDTVIGLDSGCNKFDNFPFGDNSPSNNFRYGPTGGLYTDSASIINIPDGYDGKGGRGSGTDLPLSEYDFLYSTTNRKGETGPGIGTLPGKVTVRVNAAPPSSSKMSDKFFNPRAMVMYQDSRESPPDDVSQLNRNLFALSNLERDENGAALLYNANESNQITGSFLRSHYNARDNTITYYYRDSNTNQWIISKEPWLPKNDNIGSLDKVVFSSSSNGNPHVYKWIPFVYRRLI